LNPNRPHIFVPDFDIDQVPGINAEAKNYMAAIGALKDLAAMPRRGARTTSTAAASGVEWAWG
jgi:hypothetical protein